MANIGFKNMQAPQNNGYVRDPNPPRTPHGPWHSVVVLISLLALLVTALTVLWVVVDRPSNSETDEQVAQLLDKIEALEKEGSQGQEAEAQKPQVSDDERIRELFERVERLENALPTAADPTAERAAALPAEALTNVTLNREQVVAGFSAVADQVKRCGKEKKGTITLHVVIGASGQVSSARAVGDFDGTEFGACAVRAVQSAQFPPSSRSLTVRFPYRLGP